MEKVKSCCYVGYAENLTNGGFYMPVKGNCSITLDVIPSGQTLPEDVIDEFPEMALVFKGLTTERQNTFYRFTGTVYLPGNSSKSTFTTILRAEVKSRLPANYDSYLELGDTIYL
ncbi:hypothetical protein [Serratia fonticola]|uniref:hypothetical protein n=1 Tax=Serratia fonticola TaxID=47917 RepID=UPI0024DEBCE5|nr:hypothetical protein [Serratia fonticola]MDK2375300.1 hypothetical protein [Serratia fonticola]